MLLIEFLCPSYKIVYMCAHATEPYYVDLK